MFILAPHCFVLLHHSAKRVVRQPVCLFGLDILGCEVRANLIPYACLCGTRPSLMFFVPAALHLIAPLRNDLFMLGLRSRIPTSLFRELSAHILELIVCTLQLGIQMRCLDTMHFHLLQLVTYLVELRQERMLALIGRL